MKKLYTVADKSRIRELMRDVTAGATTCTEETAADDLSRFEPIDKGHKRDVSRIERKYATNAASSMAFEWGANSAAEPVQEEQGEPEVVVFELAM